MARATATGGADNAAPAERLSWYDTVPGNHQADYVFGYADVGRLMDSPEALAGDASSSPLIVPLRVDDLWHTMRTTDSWKSQLVSVCESSIGPKVQKSGRKVIRSG